MNYKDIEIKCTPPQKQVIVSEFSQPNTLLNVIAGPGSGKTRTLCSRIAYMMSEEGGSLKSDEILVLSLTNRAVDDFKHKLQAIIGEQAAQEAQVMTFHSFAASVIREQYEDWQLLEDEELKRLCELVPKAANKKQSTNLSTMREIIRKARYVTPEELVNYETGDIRKRYGFDKGTFLKIRSLVGSHNMFTYEDILFECNRILSSGELPEFVTNYKVIIVDEFQDVYPLLAEMIMSLSKGKHLTISGDPNQSIYGFMGATPEKNWKRIAANYDNESKKLVTLSQAFRSTPELLELSSKILGQQQINIRECVKSSANLPPIRMSFDSLEDELKFVFDEIQRLETVSDGKIRYSDISVLSYTNQEVDTAYRYFKEKSKGIEGMGINRLNSTPRWLRTQLSILLQYLKILIDPRQNFPLLSSLNLLHRVGLATVNSIYMKAMSEKMYVWDFLQNPELMKEARLPTFISTFVSYVEEARTSKLDPNDPNSILKILLEMGEKFGLKRKLITSKLTEQQLDEYSSCLRSIHKSLKQNVSLKPPDETLLKFYLNNYNSHVLLNPKSNFTKLYNESEVNFSTIHTAKGLEFPIVFILSPNNFNLSDYKRRRVVYVGLTRASALLYFNKLHNQYVYSIDGSSPSDVPIGNSPDPESIHRLKVLENTARSYMEEKPKHIMYEKSPPKLATAKDLSKLLAVMGRNYKRAIDLSLVSNTLKMAPTVARKFHR
ncbi:DEKNAAC103635 [Brettanomyces naardenensis]|uniref:DNA 3'-5' helicase n=1 Tax=Brettanomyces naardenensis TaxID=13370 RepID=A0A448YNN5_BRENA|nr:DEKNAAC103635 [Brettanomyces naardenensis]